MDHNTLCHYGVKGMKWGVRRYQNKDGTLTVEGKKRDVYKRRVASANKTSKDVEDIVSTLSQEEKRKLGMLDDEKQYLTFEQGSYVAKRILKKDGDTPVAFCDIFDDGKTASIAVATRSGDSYRGKGYASAATKEGLDWYQKNKDKFGFEEIEWVAREDNYASINIAKKSGFKSKSSSRRDGSQWNTYSMK